ncbi:hypothetical protein QBC34DRAFT_412198 [Podospora aff. communis PSN243]|uniref:Uncharacterized protein n=1 Tax=Podospora aff. communis PSN243 TaxID=3040156 RepID=A0AAV9GAY2_9PEZI|nr:hypothetical protein QBC34DRAFT_412198 [Podospora aff. communis PSN243]
MVGMESWHCYSRISVVLLSEHLGMDIMDLFILLCGFLLLRMCLCFGPGKGASGDVCLWKAPKGVDDATGLRSLCT